MLLAGWLADSLSWKLDRDSSASDGDNRLFTFTTGERSISVRFTSVERLHGTSGGIVRATLSVRGEASFSVERSADGKRLVTSSKIGEEQQAEKVIRYNEATQAELLSGELSLLSNDQIYQSVASVAGQIAEIDLPQK